MFFVMSNILKSPWVRTVTTLAATSALVASCSLPGKASSKPESKSQELEQLAKDPARLRQLSSIAVGNFEKEIKGGSANLWVYAGTCAIISETLPHQPKGMVVADVVPDPGIVHMVVPKTGVTFAEAIAWDPASHKYITGEIDLLDNEASGYKVVGGNPQSNIGLANSDLRSDTVRFSAQSNNVESITGERTPVMNSIATVLGPNIAGMAYNADIRQTCINAFDGSGSSSQGVSI
jgi:hypothetical protein